MKNMIDLPAEYWHSLSLLADENGYKSRQELISYVLKVTVDQYPEVKLKGIERAGILEAARLKLKSMEGSRAELDPIVVPNMKSPGKNNRYLITLKVGGDRVVFAPTLLEAGKLMFNKIDLTIEEFWEKVAKHKIL